MHTFLYFSCTGSTWSLASEDAKLSTESQEIAPKLAPGSHHDVIRWSHHGSRVLHGCHIGWLLAHLALQWVLQQQQDKSNKNKSDKVRDNKNMLQLSVWDKDHDCLMAHDGSWFCQCQTRAQKPQNDLSPRSDDQEPSRLCSQKPVGTA